MKTVCLLGFGIQPSEQSIYDGFIDCPVWTLNDFWRFYPMLTKPDRVYQVHDNWTIDGGTRPCSGWIDKYNKCGAEIVTTIKYDGLNSRIYNYDKMNFLFGEKFHVATISYMFAEALYEGYKHIVVRGVTIRSDYDYQFELLGNIKFLKSRGITFDIYPDLPLTDFKPSRSFSSHYGWRAGTNKFYEYKHKNIEYDFEVK